MTSRAVRNTREKVPTYRRDTTVMEDVKEIGQRVGRMVGGMVGKTRDTVKPGGLRTRQIDKAEEDALK